MQSANMVQTLFFVDYRHSIPAPAINQQQHTGTAGMNFLFLNSASRGWGGNEQSLLLTADILSSKHGVVFAYRKEEIGSKARCTKYQLPFLFEGDLYTIARLVSIVKQHKIDVIIPSKRKDYAIAGVVSRLCGISNILWLGALRNLEDTWVNRLVYGTLSDGIIVNARQLKEALVESGFIEAAKAKVLYRGINSTVLDKFRRNDDDKAGKPMLVTAMGRLDKNKSHDLLLRGFARFLKMESGTEARLEILGEGNERPNLERLIETLDLKSRAVLRGFVAEPYTDLARSDVFAVTSESEGISIALLEAMYLGNAPVSTYAGGGVTDIITDGENGLLFEHGDEQALASHLLKLYREPDYQRNIANAAQRSVAEKYSADRIEQEVLAFCQEVRK